MTLLNIFTPGTFRIFDITWTLVASGVNVEYNGCYKLKRSPREHSRPCKMINYPLFGFRMQNALLFECTFGRLSQGTLNEMENLEQLTSSCKGKYFK
jgi:hypothetical protein